MARSKPSHSSRTAALQRLALALALLLLALGAAPAVDARPVMLDVVIEAGWIKRDEVCQGVKPGTVKVCG